MIKNDDGIVEYIGSRDKKDAGAVILIWWQSPKRKKGENSFWCRV